MSNIRVDREAFFRRVRKIYDTWKVGNLIL